MYLHWFRIDIMQHFLIYFSLIYYFCDISVNKNYYKKRRNSRIKLFKFNKYIKYCIQKKISVVFLNMRAKDC